MSEEGTSSIEAKLRRELQDEIDSREQDGIAWAAERERLKADLRRSRESCGRAVENLTRDKERLQSVIDELEKDRDAYREAMVVARREVIDARCRYDRLVIEHGEGKVSRG